MIFSAKCRPISNRLWSSLHTILLNKAFHLDIRDSCLNISQLPDYLVVIVPACDVAVLSGWLTDMQWQTGAGPLSRNIKMTSYQYRKSHCGDKTVVTPSYLHNGISYTGKMSSLYWIRALNPFSHKDHISWSMLVLQYTIIAASSSCMSKCTRRMSVALKFIFKLKHHTRLIPSQLQNSFYLDISK